MSAELGVTAQNGGAPAGFEILTGLVALVNDPAGFQARLEALERVTQAASAREARALKAQAKLEADKASWAAEVSAERGELNKAKAGLAQRIANHTYEVESWRERCADIEADAARWRRQHQVGIDLSSAEDMRRLHSGEFAHQGQL